MIIKAQITGIFDGRSIAAEGKVVLKDGSDVKAFFRQADESFGFGRPGYFRLALKMPAPMLLLNGERLELPEGLKHPLNDGDEVSVLTPLGGG